MEQINWTAQAVSIMGAFLILSAYVGHQLKLKIFNPENYTYNLFNAFAAMLLTYAAFHPFQIGFILMESIWGIVSIYTLLRIYKNKLKK